MSDLFDLELEVTCIFYDNQSCVKFSKNLMFHNKSKHIEIKYHYIQDMVQREVVKVYYVKTNEKIVDVLTKPLSKVKFKYSKERLGVIQVEVRRKRQ